MTTNKTNVNDMKAIRNYLDRGMYEMPLGVSFTLDKKSYVFKPFYPSKSINAIDRCDLCKFENTSYCKIFKCTQSRSDLTWAYVIEDKSVDTMVAEQFPGRKRVVCEA